MLTAGLQMQLDVLIEVLREDPDVLTLQEVASRVLANPYSRLRVGTEGTVSTVDDIGTVHVDWDDGGRLGMVFAPPAGERPDRIELVCPGRGLRNPAAPEDRPST